MLQRLFHPISVVASCRGLVKPLGLAILIACVSIGALAQAPDPAARPDRGTRPVGSYAISDIESISLQNGNLNLAIPLAALPPIAGGRLSFTVSAHYNSKNWDMKSYENEPDLNHNNQFWTAQQIDPGNTGGWRVGGQYAIYQHLAERDFEPADPGCTGGLACNEHAYRYKMYLLTPEGSQHELRPMDYLPGATQNFRIGFYKDTPGTTQAPMRYYSFDGSYLYAKIDPFPMDGFPTNWEVYLPDGTHVSYNAGTGVQKITDTNDNQIKIFSETDLQTGVMTTHYQDKGTVATGTREILVISDASGDPVQVKYQMVPPQGMSTPVVETIGIVWGDTPLVQLYNIDDRNCVDVMALLYENVHVLRSITLPATEPGQNGKQFTFFYNSDTYAGHPGEDTVNLMWRSDCSAPLIPQNTVSHGWGSLSEMNTPDGAKVKYSFVLDGDSSQARSLNGAKKASGETITQKQIEHDNVTDTWTYSIAQGAGANIGSVTGPDGSVTTENFYPHDPALAGGIGGADGKGGLVYRTTKSNVQIIERHWTAMMFDGGDSSNPNGHAPFNPVVDAEYTTMLDNSNPPQSVKMSAKTMQYDFNGNLLSQTDYDWIDLTQVTVNRDAQGVPISFPGTTVLRTVTNSYYNSATSSASINYAKRNLTTVTPLIVNAPRDSITGSSQTRLSYENQSWGTAPTTTGNLTKVSRLKSGSTFIDTTYTYDGFGNKLSVTDPDQNRTDFTFDANTHAQPTQVKVYPDRTNPAVFHATTIVYDYWTGLVISQTDPNGNATSTSYDNQLLSTQATPVSDPFGRPGKLIDPQGRKAITFYHDNDVKVENTADLGGVGDGLLKTRTTRDKIGRTIKTESSEDGVTYSISSETSYKYKPAGQNGTAVFTRNPHRSTNEPTDGWTRTTQDVLGRTVEATTFSGGNTPPDSGCTTGANCTGRVATSYDSIYTTVTDQAEKQRRSVVDALGRLVRVDEPTSSGLGSVDSPNQKTEYSYDVLGNLTLVQQSIQQRVFVYDALSRLTSAKNPEQVNAQGQMVATTYAYYDNGNLQTKTDPRGVVTTYTYDGLNRVLTRTYSGESPNPATPNVTYGYDAAAVTNSKGRLTSVSSSVSSYSYGNYDVMGRVLTGTQTTDNQPYSMSYLYNLAGGMTSETYPSNKVVVTEYDSAGRIAGVKKDQTTYYAGGAPGTANAMSYTAHGGVSTTRLGNGKWEHTNYNSRLQPELIGLGSVSSDSSLLKLDYTHSTAGQTNNNGNVRTQTITIGAGTPTPTTISQSYDYDSLNRLSGATETGAWTQTYDCDRYGNRAMRIGSYIPLANVGLTPLSANSTDFSAFDQATNRLNRNIQAQANVNYDDAGNLAHDAGSGGYSYDAENRLTNFNSGAGQYFYDGDGRRVKKFDSTGTTVFVYNAGGQLIAEYHNDPVPPAAGGGGTSYLTTDHLGSTRVVTDGQGNVKARHDYLPFGEELGAGTGQRTTALKYDAPDSTRQKFTQKERDTESGLDYFLARYYSSAQGRFTSADQPFAGQHTGDPQSWNLFAYARNNPLLYVDPLGEDYNVFDKDGNLIGQAKDQKDLKGYVLVSSENEGRLLTFEGGYRAEYFEGDAGKPVQAKDDSGMTPIARGVLTELDRSASGSLQLIGGFAVVTTAGGVIGGVAAFVAPAAVPFIVQAAQKVSVTGPSVAVSLLAKAQDPKLRRIIDALYRVTAKIGSGSSADAFRADGSHGQKLMDSIRGLENVLKNPNLSQTDKNIVNYLINDMKNALSGK